MSDRRDEIGQQIKDYNSTNAKIRRLERELAELRESVKPRECVKCQGTGQYSYPSSDGYCDCPACNGKGY